MDVHARRRENLRLLLEKTTAADLGRASGVAASYISRALKEPGDAGYKAIGEITARKLEVGARKPEGWLDRAQGTSVAPPPPAPPKGFADRHEVSESDWGLLQSIKVVLSDEEIANIRRRADLAANRYAALMKERAAAGAQGDQLAGGLNTGLGDLDESSPETKPPKSGKK